MPVPLSQPSIPRQLSWSLMIDSTAVVVTGSMTIGSVMVQLVNRLDISQDFSDYALWWSKANIWLTNTKWTLDQYGVQSDAHLNFTSIHKSIRLQLPDLRVLSITANFSVSVFAAVSKLCKDLGIRHAEELSLLHSSKLASTNVANERRTSPRRRRHNIGTLNRHNSMGDSLANNSSTVSTLCSPTTPRLRSAATNKTTESTVRHQRPISNLSKSLNSLVTNVDGNLARTPATPLKNVLSQLIKPTNIIEKSRLNGLWYDSSKSLMEQNTNENDLILLRFKYFAYYDLNPKFDAIRLNQLYEQAKWSVLSEDIDCTEEEMMTFAALQLQIQIQSHQSSSTLTSSNNDMGHEYDNANDYDIDRALECLQDSLLGTNITNTSQSTNTLIQKFSSNGELCDYLRLLKSRRFTFKTLKRYWFVMRDTQLTYYANESQQHGTPIEKISLKGCEILPDVHISSKKYAIRLMIPSLDGMNDTLIRCSTDEQYAKWMAAFRLASKGRSINEQSYETERESILALLNMQRPSSSNHQQNKFDIQSENFVSPKFVKKYKTKQLTERILEAHAAVSNLDGTEAKLRYLKAWQALPEFGITTFIVKFKDSNKREELLGIASNRLLRMTLTGDTLKTWWISRMRSWNVNWENRSVTIEFDSETIHFLPLYGIESKCIHEFIGAYIFLAMRSTRTMSDINDLIQQENLFQRLTAAYS
ncbi:unnamed protein product [Rotaria socialis]|uniref:PH domain-containing protein n=1 Tax=Rotaria socialis TaxID=392032 RepID=A0A820TBZ4_9BILA|nr:unnamed protein product [Rotaria socialis]CAF3465006.1 unnamed protein product [Rotaria socialis]CAF3469460.1 unnamed protein product [Rotaria socialis]CAF3527537.1 unnamed protein product [Rotaria socialis]CAF4126703.1 unnamed protein product [Rotaria socialis]